MDDIVERLREFAAYANWEPALEAATEIERLTLENWQLKGALGYSVPGHIPQGPFKCGMCEARMLSATPPDIERLQTLFLDHYWDSLAHVQDIVMLHVDAVLKLASENNQVNIHQHGGKE